jgi:hypothetical protein
MAHRAISLHAVSKKGKRVELVDDVAYWLPKRA